MKLVEVWLKTNKVVLHVPHKSNVKMFAKDTVGGKIYMNSRRKQKGLWKRNQLLLLNSQKPNLEPFDLQMPEGYENTQAKDLVNLFFLFYIGSFLKPIAEFLKPVTD